MNLIVFARTEELGEHVENRTGTRGGQYLGLEQDTTVQLLTQDVAKEADKWVLTASFHY